MNVKAGLMVLAVLGSGAASAQSSGLDLLHPRKYAYVIRIPRSASYQLLPGDYVEVSVMSGPVDRRIKETAVKRVQVIRVAEVSAQATNLSLAMNKREVLRLRQSLTQVQPHIMLRIVQRQPRGEVAMPPGDGVPDLDLEYTTDLAQQPIPQE